MDNQDFEKIIKKSMQIKAEPDRGNFQYLLSKIDNNVTHEENVRYNRQTAKPSNIINNYLTEFMAIWKSKRIILVPSLILLVLVGSFSLSNLAKPSINRIAQEDISIEELDVVDDEDLTTLTSFEDQIFDDLGTIQDEI